MISNATMRSIVRIHDNSDQRFPPHCSWRILSTARSTLQPDVFWAARQSMPCLARSPSRWPNGETPCSALAGSVCGVRSVACVHPKSNLEFARLRRDSRYGRSVLRCYSHVYAEKRLSGVDTWLTRMRSSASCIVCDANHGHIVEGMVRPTCQS
jgi:hypothetical protein